MEAAKDARAARGAVLGAGFREIERANLSAKVYESLRSALTTGELKPGDRLTGRMIAEELGVSMTPVREALLQLVAERALAFSPNRSVSVPRLTPDQFAELRDIRVALEGLAIRLAAERAAPEDVAALEKIHRRMIAAKRKRDYRTTLHLNRDFHFGAYRMSGRQELVAMIEALWLRTGPYLNLLYRSANPGALERHEHENMIAALRAHDGEKAERALARDIIPHAQIIVESLGRSA